MLTNKLISVIILTHNCYSNKYGCIEHCILSFINQKNVNKELIVVDNSNRYQDSHKLERFISTLSLPIKVVTCKTNVSTARNLGAQFSTGDILVFTEEDTIMISDINMSNLSESFDNYSHGYGAKRYWTKPDNWFLDNAQRLRSDILFSDYTFFKNHVEQPRPSIRDKENNKYLVKTFIGNFGFIKKEVFFNVGGFPESFDGYGGEDDALSFLCYLQCGRPFIMDNIEVAHVNHPIKSYQLNEYEKNRDRYEKLLSSYGYKSFHIGDLLYPEEQKDRPILE